MSRVVARLQFYVREEHEGAILTGHAALQSIWDGVKEKDPADLRLVDIEQLNIFSFLLSAAEQKTVAALTKAVLGMQVAGRGSGVKAEKTGSKAKSSASETELAAVMLC